MGNNRKPTTNIPNIIIFGVTGAGKSSIINLVAGEQLARTSNKAVGCTFEHQSYVVTVRGVKCRLWDTTGLDEGTEGTVPAATAKRNLKKLMKSQINAGGINLVIYCIRTGRATVSLQHNYRLFYSGVFRKKVPIALVITGLEFEENGMETWWDREERVLRRFGMLFDEHVCVTTLERDDPVIQERRLDSQRRLRHLIATYSKEPSWIIEKDFVSKVVPAYPGLSQATPSSDTETTRIVITYDMTADSQSSTSRWPTRPHTRGGQQYEFIRVDKRLWESPKQSPSLPDGGLLIFYTSHLVRDRICKEDVEALEKFYTKAGGEMYPVIVVLRGCSDQEVARNCWRAFTSSHSGIQAEFLPDTTGGPSDDDTGLMNAIEKLWTCPVAIKPSLLRRVQNFVLRR